MMMKIVIIYIKEIALAGNFLFKKVPSKDPITEIGTRTSKNIHQD